MAVTRMTEGSIPRHLISYSVPLLLGNLFQLTYNAVDSIIVGRWIGTDALAAVGTCSPVMNILVLGISGITLGSGVLMSQFFGAQDEAKIKKEFSTTLLFGLWFSLAVVLLGGLFARVLLRALQVPDEVLDMAVTYLRIIFLGAPFTYCYNAVSGALKSVGDSRTALRFLAFSSLLNAGLDVVFIGFLGFGIVCSAVTTVVAEAVSALLCILYVYKAIPLLQLSRSEFCIDLPLLGKTLRYGGVTALQQSCQPVGKLLIQGVVNACGVSVMAAFNAVTRVDDYAFTPEQSISHGMTTFIAQNRGARRPDRVRCGSAIGMLLEVGYWGCVCALVFLLREPLLHLFVGEDQQAAAQGAAYLGLMAFFYLFPALTNGMQGMFRGMGRMEVTLLGTFTQTCLRVVFTFLLVPRLGILGVAYAGAAGWSAMLLVEVPLYFWLTRKGSKAAREMS